jgi:CheY-like chemotaxis protein
MNLCTNAAHAMRGTQGRLTINLDLLSLTDNGPRPHVELVSGEHVRLTVSDTGHGMDEITVRRIFEPFFTTKGPGEGTGLGLSVVHGIIKEHEGVIAVESTPGTGTTIVIYLPARAAAVVQAETTIQKLPHGHGERVMYVDDEAALGEVVKKILVRLGYQPIVFQSSSAAWEAFQQEPYAYDVLISDYTMPVLTGVDLARRVLELRPGLPVILVSGYNTMVSSADLRCLGIREVLNKPVDHRVLAHHLDRILRPAAAAA